MLVRCLYASRAAGPITPDFLESILEQARRNNPTAGITGLLCFAGDTFVQVIEGGRGAICELLVALARDGRHRNIRLLSYGEIAERQFGTWTMGQINLAHTNPALLLKYYERAELNPFEAPGQATLALLGELMATGAITGRDV